MTPAIKKLTSDGKNLLSAKLAAKRLDCDPDYVGKLCREGKLLGERVDGAWFVSEESIGAYQAARELARRERSESLANLRRLENKNYKKISEPASVRAFKKVFYSVPFSIAVFALCVAVVFAGTAVSPYFTGGLSKTEKVTAALGHVESPFFGTAPFSPDFSTGIGNTIAQGIKNFIAGLFDNQRPIAQNPAPIVPPATPTPSVPVSASPAQIVNNTYPVIERVVTSSSSGNWVSMDVFMTVLGAFHQSFRNEVTEIVGNSISQSLENLTVTGGGLELSDLTDANIPDGITVSSYLPLVGGTLTGALTVTGATSTFDGVTVASLDCTSFAAGGKLTTDASGNIVCANDGGGSGSPGGADTQVQYNDAGVFNGNASFTFDGATGRVNITNLLATNATSTNATSTNFAITSLGTATGAFLAVDPNGRVIATTTPSSGGAAFPFSPTAYGVSTSTTVGFTSGLLSVGSTTIIGNATTTGMQGVGSLFINSERFTDLTGSGLSNSSGALTVAGLTTSNFTSANISQWTNDAGYVTSASFFAYPFPLNATSTTLTFSDGLVSVGSTTVNGNLIVTGNSTTTNATTTALAISSIASDNLLKTTTGGAVVAAVAGTDYVTGTGLAAAYPFPLTGNATSTLTQFNGGLTAYASTTIGGGAALTGLTISGNSTTTGSAYFAGNVGIGKTNPGGYQLDVEGLAKFVDADNNGFSFDTDYPSLNSSFLTVYYPTGSRAVLRSDISSNYLYGTTTFDSNVGIGTTSPYARLSVEGASALGNSATAGYFIATTTTASQLRYASTTVITATTASTTNLTISSIQSSLLKTLADGTVAAAVAGTDYALPGTGSFDYPFPSNATSTLLSFTGGILANAASSTITNLVTVNSTSTNATTTNLAVSGNITFDGVTGNNWSDFCLSITGGAGLCDGVDSVGSGGNGLATSTDISDTWIIYGTSAADVGAESEFTYDDLLNKLTVANASTTAITAFNASTTNLSAYALAIGATATSTFSSTGALTVPGSSGIFITDNVASGAQLLRIGDDTFFTDTDSGNTLGLYGQSDSTIGSLQLGSGGAILSGFSGRIGIGEYTPGSTLAVSGNGTFGSAYDTTAAPANGLLVEGTVGIGETSPASKLSVAGNASVGSSYSAIAAPTNGLIVEGNVGIGTTSPFVKLSVGGSAYIGGNLTATGTLAVEGNTSLQNATTTALAITTLQSTLLKTDASGNVIPAVAGSDYVTAASVFAYPFPNNATTTRLTFGGGASTTNLSANTLAVGGTATTSISADGSLTIQTLNGILKATNGLVSVATPGTDYANFAYLFPSNATSTTLTFTGGLLSTASSTINASTTITGVLTASGGIFGNVTGNLTGNANTATALAANGTNCSAGLAAGGIDASGNAEDCTAYNTWSWPFPGNATSTTLTFNSGLVSVGSTTINGNLIITGNSTTTNATTTALAISSITNSLLKTNATGGVVAAVAGTDYLTSSDIFAYPFFGTGNSTSTLTQFNGGLTSFASSTIGAGGQTTGLTISGGATTTGYLTVQGNSTSTFAAGIQTTALNVTSSSATSTFANGITIAGGCFAINGTCFGAGAANAGGSNGQIQYNSSGILAGAAGFTFDSSLSKLTVTNASTTDLSVEGTASTTNLTVSSIANALLSTSNGGVVGATTISSPLSFSGTTLSISQAGSGSSGYLSSTDWSLFNNKISSSSLSGASVISYTSSTGVITTTAGTFGGSASSVYTFPGDLIVTGNATTTNATTTNLYVDASVRGAGLTSCSTSADKLIWNSTTGQFGCLTDQTGGGGGSDVNWTFFNGSGIRLSTTTNQVLIGHTSTSTLSKLEVVGGATFDYATTTTFRSSGLATFGGNVGVGTTSPTKQLVVAGGTILQTAAGNPTLASSITIGGASYNTFVSGKYAYVAANAGGLKILDITNPESPVLVGAYAGASTARDVVVAGRYAYVANFSAGLQIIDVSNPASPSLVGSYTTTGQSSSLAVSGKYVFITDFLNDAVRIVDVSNPSAPVLAGTYSNTRPNAVAVSGKYLYVALFAPEFAVVDISNPASPVAVGSYSTDLDSPQDVYVAGRIAYLADGATGLHIIDVSNPASPSLISQYNPGGSASYYSVQVAGNYAYLAEHATGELVVADVSDPSAVLAVGSYATGTTPPGVFVAGKYAYVGSESTTLDIVDINGTELPAAHIGALDTSVANIGENLTVGGDIYAGGGLDVGISGIFSRGIISAFIASTTQSNPTVATFMGGNVGIGTTSPYARLSVVGTAVAANFVATTTTASQFPYASTTAITATTASTTNLVVSGIQSSLLKTLADGTVAAAVAGTDYASASSVFAYPFGLAGNATSTLTQFNGGLTAYASSTIGDGTQAGGLTVNGGATTTGNAYIAGNVGIGAASPTYKLNVSGTINASGGILGQFFTATNGSSVSSFYGLLSTAISNAYPAIRARNASSGTQNIFEAQNNSGVALTVINGSGSLGIGNTSPNEKLNVQGIAAAQALYATSTAITSLFSGGLTVSGTTTLANATTTALAITTLQSTLLKTDSNGNVIPAIAGTDYASAASIFAFPFTVATNFGATANSTSTPIWFQAGIQSSSTNQLEATNLWGNLGFQATTSTSTLATYGGQSLITLTPNTSTGSSNGNNVGFGPSALVSTNGSTGNNTAVGYRSLNANTSGFGNAALGTWSLEVNTTGASNAGFGAQALRGNTTGSNNTAVGALAVFGNTTGSDNVGIGAGALRTNTTGNQNVAIGTNALRNKTIASSTVAIGYEAGQASGDSKENVFLGYQAGRSNSTGDNNTLLGFASGKLVTTGYGNVGVGASSTINVTTGSNNVALGNFTYFPDGTANNQLNIGNLIFGTIPATSTSLAGTDLSTGRLGIGTTTPYSRLTVWGSDRIFEAVNSASTSVFYVGQSGATTTALAITTLQSTLLKTDASGNVIPAVAGTDYAAASSLFAYPFPNNATSTTLTFSGGLVSVGSTTINGNSTTTGNAYFGGNVGIGTASPSGALQVVGDAQFDNGVYVSSDPVAANRSRIYESGGLHITPGDATRSIFFEIGTDEKARVDSNGNFGIGNTSPTYKLTVGGAGQFSGLVDADHFVATSSSATSTLPQLDVTGLQVATHLDVDGTASLQNATTTALAITTLQSTLLKTDASGNVIPAVAGTDYASAASIFAFPFDTTSYGVSTSTLVGFTGGLLSGASTTINASTTVTGVLTASGGIFGNVTGNLTGTASLATALAANGTNCNAGEYALGVDASGNAESCTDVTTEITAAVNAAYPFQLTGNATSTLTQFNGGLTAYASSTIGNGVSGLTISGGSTTTGNAYFAGSIGIGTSSPEAQLDIQGGSGAALAYITTNTDIGSSPIASLWFGVDRDGVPNWAGIGQEEDGSLRFTGSAENLSVPDMVITDAGLVGIGTTTFTNKFTVDGGDAFIANGADTKLFIGDMNNYLQTNGDFQAFAASSMRFTATGGAVFFQNGGGAKFQLGGTAEADTDLFVNNSGNAAIGTTTPYSRLTLWGNDSIFEAVNSASSTIFKVGQSGATTTALAITTINSMLLKTDVSGNVIPAIAGTDYATPANIASAYPFPLTGNATGTLTQFNGGLTAFGSSTIGNGTQGGGLTVSGTATTSNLIVTGTSATSTIAGGLAIETSGFVYDFSSNKVGIGTAAPVSKLHVQTTNNNVGTDDIDATVDVIFEGSDGNVAIIGNNSGTYNSGFHLGEVTSGTFADQWSIVRGTSNGSRASALGFRYGTSNSYGNNTEFFTMTKTGEFGIGTTSPYAKLSVVGQAVAAYFTATTTTASTFPYASTTAITATTASTTNLVVSALGPSAGNCLTTDSTGLVTSQSCSSGSSAYPFGLTGNATSTLTQFSGGLTAYASTTIGNGLQAGGLTISGGSTTTGNAYFAGYVGIGNTAPLRPLQVEGSVSANYIASFTQNNASGYGAYIFANSNSDTLDALKIQGWTGSAAVEVLNAKTNGSVAIGTTTPYSKLSVWGSGTSGNQLFSLVDSASTTLLQVLDNGKVGIGTTSPYAKLAVTGEVVANNFTATSTAATSTFAGGVDIGGGALTYDYGAGLTSIDNLAIGALGFDTDAGIVSLVDLPVTSAASAGTVESYTAYIDGNPLITAYAQSDGAGGIKSQGVGIGTTSPSAILTVWNATTTDSLIANFVNISSTTVFSIGQNGATSTNFAVTGTASTSALVISGLGPSAGQCLTTSATGAVTTTSCGGGSAYPFGLTGNATSTLTQFNGGLTAYASTTIGSGLQAGGLTISGGSTTTGNAYFAGNVGVGTTTTSVPLSIQGTVANSGFSNAPLVVSNLQTGTFINALAAYAPANTTANNRTCFNVGVNGAANNLNSFCFKYAGDGSTSNAFDIFFSFQSNPVATFMANGNVGVGSSTPAAKLSVTGTGTGTGKAFEVTDSGNFANFTILDNGKVGIGTTSPYAKLAVTGEVVANNFTATSTAATSTFAGGVDIGGGALTYDYGAGLTSIDNLAIGAMSFDTDAGQVSWADLPVSSSASGGTVESYSAQIDGNPLLTVYAQADGSGGIQNSGVGVGTTSPYSKLTTWGSGSLFEAVTSASSTIFSIGQNGATSTNFAVTGTASTSALVISSLGPSAGQCLTTSATGLVTTTSCGGGASFAYPFGLTGNATSTLTQFNGGLTAFASSTIGSGTQAGGLTISGGSTTTLNAYFAGKIGIGTTSPSLKLSITDAVSTGQQMIAYDGSNFANMLVNATGDLVITTSGGDVQLSNDNFFVCQSGSCPTTTATSTAGNLFVENAVTIGSGFSFREIDSDELGLYEPNGSLMVIFDEGI